MSSNTTGADCFQKAFLHPRYWGIWLVLGVTALIARLPYFMLAALGRGIGRFFFMLDGSRVQIARVNVTKCFPQKNEAEIEKLLRSNFESVGMGIIEVLMAWWWPRKRLEKWVSYEGLEHLQSGVGQGNMLMIMHFTTIEIGGALIALQHSLDATYREHKNPVFEYMQRRQRQRYDKDSRLLGRRNVRGMLRSLRQGKTVWYSPDQDYGSKQSVFAPFFNIKAASVTGTARMVKIGKARLIPMMVTRNPECDGYKVEVFPAWDDFPVGDDVKDATRVNRFVQKQVEKHPEQYMWLHRRFKTRPEGEASFYKK